MKFTNIAKDFPTTWEDFETWFSNYCDEHEAYYVWPEYSDEIDFKSFVGYLILDYLPSKGIYVGIKRFFHDGIWRSIYYLDFLLSDYDDADVEDNYDTLEQTIYTAFKLLEGRGV